MLTVHGAPFFKSPRFPDRRVVLFSLHLSMASLSGYRRDDFMIQIEHLTYRTVPRRSAVSRINIE